ncbi:hypothetical protein LINPERPRIM_LOCUS3948 [Linum perenne]
MRVSLQRGALEEYDRMVTLLTQIPRETFAEGPPALVWSLTGSKVFSVRSLNAQLRGDKFPGRCGVPVETIWSKEVPTKVQGILWLVFHGRILTLDVLKKRGFQMANRCSLCGSQEESVSHLFINCNFVYPIWSKISSRLSLSEPSPREAVDFITGWKGLNCGTPFELMSRVVLHSFVWHVWLERNELSLERRRRRLFEFGLGP